MEQKLNEKQTKVLAFLKSKVGAQFTLAEIGQAIGEEVKSGTTNTLVKKGLMISHPKAREIVCPCCGRKTTVSTYEIA